jgi:hypothetical protein
VLYLPDAAVAPWWLIGVGGGAEALVMNSRAWDGQMDVKMELKEEGITSVEGQW